MSILIRGGTVVTAEQSFRADVYCENGTIVAIGDGFDPPVGAEVVDAGGMYVMPGGIDPHTHMELPFMGTVASEDFFSGTSAGAAGGTTTIIDFVIPGPQQSLVEAYHQWRSWGEKAATDYSFHVAVTWWSDQVREEMGVLTREHGVNSFKHFMAYKGAIMVDDGILLNSFARAQELGALCTVHAENGDAVFHLQKKMLDQGITGPEGHALSRPPQVERRGSPARHRHRQCAGSAGLYRPCLDRTSHPGHRPRPGIRPPRLRRGPRPASRDRRVRLPEPRLADGRRLCHEPAVPPEASPGRSVGRADFRRSPDHATDHCCFCAPQKAAGRDNFTKIPNGTGGIEDRMSVLWHIGVGTGRLTPNEFVRITSTNCAQIFNLYPRKGAVQVGADADLVVWDPEGTRTISARTHHQNVDFNIYEGMEVKGIARHTLSQGKLVWTDGDLRTVRGAGRCRSPCFPPVFKAIDLYNDLHKPVGVDREVATAVTP